MFFCKDAYFVIYYFFNCIVSFFYCSLFLWSVVTDSLLWRLNGADLLRRSNHLLQIASSSRFTPMTMRMADKGCRLAKTENKSKVGLFFVRRFVKPVKHKVCHRQTRTPPRYQAFMASAPYLKVQKGHEHTLDFDLNTRVLYWLRSQAHNNLRSHSVMALR